MEENFRTPQQEEHFDTYDFSSVGSRALNSEYTENDQVLTPTTIPNAIGDGWVPVNLKRKAEVWKEYNCYEDVQKNLHGVCKHCQEVSYRAESKNGTSNFKRHLASCSKYKNLAGSCMTTSHFDQKVYSQLVCESIMKHGLPFSHVEYEGERKVHRYLNPNVKPICRNTAKKICLEKHAEFKEILKAALRKNSSRICLTCDIWTACTGRGYLTLTAHYVDDNWKLNSKVLSFCHCPPPHTGIEIYNLLHSLIMDWGIEKKIFTMTVDNASNMINMIMNMKSKLLGNLVCDGKFFHIPCSAHILNLIVKEGMKNIEECVVKVRESVKYIDGSEGRIIKFYEYAVQLNISVSAKLWLDVATRWNSTYLMLSRALHYNRVLDYYALNEPNFKWHISSSEWIKVKKICDLLQPFYDITNLFSGTEYPTSNLYFFNVWTIQRCIEKAMSCDDMDISRMATQMYEKFGKYWFDYSMILAFAIIFDPRYKFDFVTFAFTKLYGTDKGSRMAKEVYAQLLDLYKYYEDNCQVDSCVPSMSNPTQREVNTCQRNDDIGEFDSSIFLGASNIGKTELESYHEIQRMERLVRLDVLSYWKDKSSCFPILSSMAKDILAIPITTVASESTFSMGGRILNKWRNSLLPKNVDVLVTTHNWLFGYGDLEKDGSIVDFSEQNNEVN